MLVRQFVLRFVPDGTWYGRPFSVLDASKFFFGCFGRRLSLIGLIGKCRCGFS